MTPDPLFDYEAARLRRRRAQKVAIPGADFLMRRVAQDLAERLEVVERNFAKSVSLFSSTDQAAIAMAGSGKCPSILRLEEECYQSNKTIPVLTTSPDMIALQPGSINLAVSLLSMHRFNDLPGFLSQVSQSLKPDGLFLGAIPAAGTLAELRESLLAAEAELCGSASARVLPFADVRQLGGLLQRAGLTLPVTDVDTVTVRYDTMFDLIGDLRAMAATNTLVARRRVPDRRGLFMRAAEIYSQQFADPDGRIRATFSIAWLSGWCPHESQQKPARRGSGTVSLTEILRNKP